MCAARAFSVALTFIALLHYSTQDCTDVDPVQCPTWKGLGYCEPETSYAAMNCKISCGRCTPGSLPKKYDTSNLPEDLRPIGYLLGRWRSEFGGKAVFPTIPIFTYGEEIDISLADASPNAGGPLFNYTAFAWSINDGKELHSEYGFITAKGTRVALNLVMNNGFTTVEEGTTFDKGFQVRLKDIGRISFSRDLPVTGLRRKFTSVSPTYLEQLLEMETLTHELQEHTRILYEKIYP